MIMVRAKKKSSKIKKVKKETVETSFEETSLASKVAVKPVISLVDAYKRIVGEVEDYAIILLDTKGDIRSWNKGAEKVKGYSAAEIIGKNYRIFYSREDKNMRLPEKILAEATKKGNANYEGWRIKKGGTRFWGSITLTALHEDDGSISGYLKVTRDLTERKMTEDQQSNLIEELKAKNEELKKSEDRYHKLISEVQDYAIILMDKDGKILDWNKGAERLKGYKPEEIIGKNFRLFYTREDKEAKLPEKLLAEAVRKGSILFEGWRIRKDGSRFWGSISITALHDDEGEVIGYSKVTRDLTSRKAADDQLNIITDELIQKNEELRRSEIRYHRMISEVRDYAIILLDKKGNIENWNAGAEQIKGYKAEEAIGKNFRMFYTKEDLDRKLPQKLIQEAMRSGRVTHEGWRLRKDGTRFWGSVVITALHEHDGKLIGFSKVTRDLTDKKYAEDNLKANAAQLDLKNKTLERLNDELSTFTHVASHDLKEPLRKIQLFASRIAAKDYLLPGEKNDVEKIRSSAARMQNLMEDLLAFSLVSNDTSKFEPLDLNEIIESVKKNDLEVAINEKKAVIKVGKLPILNGVRFQFHQLFLNLLSNAVKFSKPGLAPVIKISSNLIKGPDIPGQVDTGNNKYHQISIADNGIGFSQEYSTRIFAAFERLHSREVFAGTGIGLAIVKKVVENHNGIVVAEGVPDEGATFHVYLPLSNHS